VTEALRSLVQVIGQPQSEAEVHFNSGSRWEKVRVCVRACVATPAASSWRTLPLRPRAFGRITTRLIEASSVTSLFASS
jgi:hypothetical protein